MAEGDSRYKLTTNRLGELTAFPRLVDVAEPLGDERLGIDNEEHVVEEYEYEREYERGGEQREGPPAVAAHQDNRPGEREGQRAVLQSDGRANEHEQDE